MLVKDVIERYPQTIAVFVRRRLNCIGCYIAPFHTVTDTAREHALTTEALLLELNQSIREPGCDH